MVSPTELQIGCITLTIEKWREKRIVLGKANEYTAQQLEEYRLYIELAAQLYPPGEAKNESST